MRASVLIALLALAGCHRAPAQVAQPAPALSMLKAADPKAAGQLVEGFFSVEDGAWRWTGKHFDARVRAPDHAEDRGATLRIDLTVPPPVLQHTPHVTLSCAVDGTRVADEKYDKPGSYKLEREVKTPLPSPGLDITCDVDPAYKPGGADQRELGVIVSRIGLAPR